MKTYAERKRPTGQASHIRGTKKQKNRANTGSVPTDMATGWPKLSATKFNSFKDIGEAETIKEPNKEEFELITFLKAWFGDLKIYDPVDWFNSPRDLTGKAKHELVIELSYRIRNVAAAIFEKGSLRRVIDDFLYTQEIPESESGLNALRNLSEEQRAKIFRSDAERTGAVILFEFATGRRYGEQDDFKQEDAFTKALNKDNLLLNEVVIKLLKEAIKEGFENPVDYLKTLKNQTFRTGFSFSPDHTDSISEFIEKHKKVYRENTILFVIGGMSANITLNEDKSIRIVFSNTTGLYSLFFHLLDNIEAQGPLSNRKQTFTFNFSEAQFYKIIQTIIRSEDTQKVDKQDSKWRLSGNLRGNPPVRSENPPNINVIEDETTYNNLLFLARASLSSIKRMAGSMLDGEEVTNHKYWFTKVYQYVTENELEYIKTNAFYYPSYVLRSVIYFEKMYRDNVAAVTTNRVEAHWKKAFETSDEKEDDLWIDFMDAVESMIESMFAHIRFDLPRAEAWVFNSYYKFQNGVNIKDFIYDFMSMAGVFDNAGERMSKHVYDRFSFLAKGIMKTISPLMQEQIMKYWHDADILSERADTWKRAEQLINKGLATDDPYSIINNKFSGNVTSDNYQADLKLLQRNLIPDMESNARLDDNHVREKIRKLSHTEISKLAISNQIRFILGLLSGFTIGKDETAILKILNASKEGEVVTIIDGVSAWNLMYAIDGNNYKKLRDFLRKKYYGKTLKQTAFNLITKCLNGATAEWEEEMIMDILEARSFEETYALIVETGQTYKGKSDTRERDYKNGMSELEQQLSGKEENRLQNWYMRFFHIPDRSY